jgi:hypothetical protein
VTSAGNAVAQVVAQRVVDKSVGISLQGLYLLVLSALRKNLRSRAQHIAQLSVSWRTTVAYSSLFKF